MTETAPHVFTWDGAAMWPLIAARARERFRIGQRYQLEVAEARSPASHGHYFAEINNAWLNLPERLAANFPSAEHLRKYALVQAGYCNTLDHVCGSARQAGELMALIRMLDTYAVIEIRGRVLRVSTARSQSRPAMDRKTFEESKRRVLDVIAGLIGVSPADLCANATRAA